MPPAPPTPLTIHLVRHGQTDWNLQRRIQGGTDIPLNATGVDQARQAAEQLEGRPIGALYSSDLARARDTAAPIAARTGLEVILEPALRERHHGIAEGRRDADLQVELNGQLHELMGQPDFTFPDGESRRDVHARVKPFLDRLLEDPPTDELVLVSHAGTLRIVRAILEGLPIDHTADHVFANGSVTTLELARDYCV